MIEPPVRDPLAFDALLSSSWALFRRNWIVALPPVIAAGIIIVAAVALAAVALAIVFATGSAQHQPSTSSIAVIVLLYVVLGAGGIVLSVWAYAAMFGMADAAWTRGTATLADGNAAFRSRGGALVVAVIGLIGVGIVALILALPTLFIALLAFPLFTMYVMPAAVGGGRGGFEAIGESFRLVRRFFLPSLIACVVLFGISYGISLVGVIPLVPLELATLPSAGETTPNIPSIPLLVFGGVGYLFAIALQLAYSGFYAIALVGMYRSLTVPPAAATAGEIVAG
jgi:hypothetical protein